MVVRPARLVAMTGAAVLASATLTPVPAFASVPFSTAPTALPPAAKAASPSFPAAARTASETARAKVTYPRGSRAYTPITYTWTVWRSYVFEGSALVLYTDINRANVSRIRFIQKAPDATCGVRRETTDYNVYCVVTRPERWKRLSMRFKVWPRRVTQVVADHYWGEAEFDGGTADSLAQARDRLGRSRTKLYY